MEHGYSDEQLAIANQTVDKRRKFAKGYSVVTGTLRQVVPYEHIKIDDGSLNNIDKIREDSVKEAARFNPASLNVEKEIHAVDYEAARIIYHYLDKNKRDVRDKNGQKVIKLPFDDDEQTKKESIQIYQGLKKKFMTEKEIREEKEERTRRVSKYL